MGNSVRKYVLATALLGVLGTIFFFEGTRYYLFFLLINLDILSLLSACCLLWIPHLRFFAWRKRALCISLGIFALIALSPLARIALYRLEHRIPERFEIPNNVEGLILLGGTFSLEESIPDKRPVYNLAAGRLMEFVSLAHHHPTLPILFTGTPLEAKLTAELFEDLGLDPKRFHLEKESLNTVDNAAKTFQLIRPSKNRPWILVTSAFHMPRSLGLFKGQGWNVIPYPVDYHTQNVRGWKRFFLGLDRHNCLIWKIVVKEWAGLVNNYLSGKTSELFPKSDL